MMFAALRPPQTPPFAPAQTHSLSPLSPLTVPVESHFHPSAKPCTTAAPTAQHTELPGRHQRFRQARQSPPQQETTRLMPRGASHQHKVQLVPLQNKAAEARGQLLFHPQLSGSIFHMLPTTGHAWPHLATAPASPHQCANLLLHTFLFIQHKPRAEHSGEVSTDLQAPSISCPPWCDTLQQALAVPWTRKT